MNRGKIIAALAVVLAIGLVAFWLLTDLGNGASVGSGEGGLAIQSPAGQEANDPGPQVSGDSQAYVIDPVESEVIVRVYRAGALARLGHNHVISVAELDGSVTLSDDQADVSWELSFPVNSLIIDDPDLRARYGEDFESVPSEEDKAGTKVNMLTDRLLDGANFLEIRLEGNAYSGSLDAASLPVSIHMLGRTIEQTFPASISVTTDSVTVSGEHRLTHADLGLEPFSVLRGAMAVGEDIDISYSLRANAVSP